MKYPDGTESQYEDDLWWFVFMLMESSLWVCCSHITLTTNNLDSSDRASLTMQLEMSTRWGAICKQ